MKGGACVAWRGVLEQTCGVYLEAQQDAQVPRRPVVEGVHQVFVGALLRALALQVPVIHAQAWPVITLLFLGMKHSKGR